MRWSFEIFSGLVEWKGRLMGHVIPRMSDGSFEYATKILNEYHMNSY